MTGDDIICSTTQAGSTMCGCFSTLHHPSVHIRSCMKLSISITSGLAQKVGNIGQHSANPAVRQYNFTDFHIDTHKRGRK